LKSHSTRGSLHRNRNLKPSSIRNNLFSERPFHIVKAFIKSVLRQAAVQIFASLLVIVVFFIIMMGILGNLASSNMGPPVEAGSVLTINLANKITDAPPPMDPAERIMQSLFSEEGASIHLYKLLETIDKAERDPRIKGIYLHGNYLPYDNSTGYAGLREIRDALKKFQKAGKPVYASAFSPNLHTYYLISCADKLYLNPFSDIQLNGIGAEYTFYSTALEKLGVGIQPVRVGKYKAAIEPFTRENFSEEAKAQLQELLDDRWGTIFAEIAENRKIKPEDLQQILDKEFHFKAEEALEAGLVDALAKRSEIYKEIAENAKWDDEKFTFKQISLQEYAEPEEMPDLDDKKGDTIAVVYVEGAIVNGKSMQGYAGSETIHQQLTKLANRSEVKGIVLRVNSPGGSASASEIIQQALLDCKAKGKSIVASMGATAASGGYWVSASADRILAQPETVTGSIGVFGMLFDIEKMGEKLGLAWDTVSSAQHLNPYAISRPKTPEELQEVQEYVDNIYDIFINNVAEYRKLDVEKVNEVAQGRVWTGPKALDHKLVDEIGGLMASIQAAADLQNLSSYEVEHFPEDLTGMELLDKLLEENFSSVRHQTQNPVHQQIQKLVKDYQSLQHWNDPRNAYVRLPFELN
jgi:protease-4